MESEEDVPNDCAPCWNHVVVRGEDAELKATFLDLPERVTKEIEVFGFTPRVSHTILVFSMYSLILKPNPTFDVAPR